MSRYQIAADVVVTAYDESGAVFALERAIREGARAGFLVSGTVISNAVKLADPIVVDGVTLDEETAEAVRALVASKTPVIVNA